MEEAPKGPPWWQDESPSLVRTPAGEGRGLWTSCPVFFSIIFSFQRAALHPSLEVQAVKGPAKSKQKEIGKGDRSPDSRVSLVGLGWGWRSAWWGHVVHQWKTWAPEAGVPACECRGEAPRQEWAGDGGGHHAFG